MKAEPAQPTETPPPRRFGVTPFVELLVLAGALAIAIASYFIISGGASSQALLTPQLVAFLLVANLLPGVALLVLLGRRIAMRRAARSPIGGRGRLHVRLVALFSVIAAVPTLLVVIFASLLFQYGVEFWYSSQTRGMLENATDLARTSRDQVFHRWQEATVTMASDVAAALRAEPIDGPGFSPFFFKQVYFRSLSDGIVFGVSPKSGYQTLATLNPDNIDIGNEVPAADIVALRKGAGSIVSVKANRIQTVTMLPGAANLFLFTAALDDLRVMETQTKRAEAVEQSYRNFLTRARSLQLKFNAALLGISLLIVAISVWIALAVADRLVRPVGELVAAARRVATGDLTAQVSVPRTDDEVGTLASAFNQMTDRLRTQTNALDSRRALIEAVMSGVSAGVVSIAGDGAIRLINRSAETLLKTGEASPVGRQLGDVAPELANLLAGDRRDAIVQIDTGGEPRTLAVRIARDGAGDGGGAVLTFDDITEQLLDQRRAAWSDVARRIAHEIKNPLTPIQLAAERLQRRYGKQIASDDGTFARLTETIVRQVGDLRRMVDEFSSFARMPKPVFHAESLVDLARQAVFLHEVAHPAIDFTLYHEEPGPILICDRRQIGQALTNIVKNAVEAVEARGDGVKGAIEMVLAENGNRILVQVSDNGVGLPAARDRLVEPYMTTRARGTGLGLAIVNKIAEEHFGTIAFADREGGGTVVTMAFDALALAALDAGEEPESDEGDRRPAELTRNRT